MQTSGKHSTLRAMIDDPLQRIDHRPWPLPERPWVMRMDWNDLAFLNWPVPAGTMAALLPAGMVLDTHDGMAWVGVVPFAMGNVGPHAPLLHRLRIPGINDFLECNVRTYVTMDGKPGVFFFSLDCESRLAVEAARRTFGLNYFRAQQSVSRAGDEVVFASHRNDPRLAGGNFVAAYRPTGPVYRSQPGTLDHWFTERYALYAVSPRGKIVRGDIHHLPWPLQPGSADISTSTVTVAHGLPVHGEPIVHFAKHISVRAWAPVEVQP